MNESVAVCARCWIVVLVALCSLVAVAEDDPVPVADLKLAVWAGGLPDSNGLAEEEAVMSVFFPAAEKNRGAAVVVCPGGGYGGLAIDHEGWDIVRWLNGHGVTAIVLQYRLPNGDYTIPIGDAQQALKLVRRNATTWKIDPERIGILGFSAGGHLASSVTTHFREDYSLPKGGIAGVRCRPDFSILIYPVITMEEVLTHPGSRRKLLGQHPDAGLVARFSNHLRITGETPPTFLVHSKDDEVVPVENSVQFYDGLKEKKVSAELHLFETGGHGYGLGRDDHETTTWPKLCVDWMMAQGILGE